MTMKRKQSKSAIEKVKDVFFTSPTTQFHLRALARQAKLSAPATAAACKELTRIGVLKRTVTPPTITYAALHEEKPFRDEKRLWNIRLITESGLIEQLVTTTKPEAIVLFGSFSRGEDWERSDIDIALINPKKENPPVGEFERKLGKELQLLSISKRSSKELLNNITNGIVVYGRWDPL